MRTRLGVSQIESEINLDLSGVNWCVAPESKIHSRSVIDVWVPNESLRAFKLGSQSLPEPINLISKHIFRVVCQ